MKIRVVAAVLAALAVVLTGCASADEKKASEAIAQELMQSEDETFKVDEKEATCVGDGFVDEIGVEKLKEYGVVNEDLEASGDFGQDMKMSEDDAGKAADTMLECMDVKKAISESMGSQLEGQPETQRCVEDALTDENLRAFMVAMFSGDETKAQEVLMGDLMECVMGSMGEGGDESP